MAKIFYVTKNTPDYAQVKFFKTEKEALKYGASELEGFEMYEEPMNDEESMYDSESWYQGDSLTFKKGILFSFEEGEVYVQAMEEDAAREYAQELGEWGAAIFFEGFKKGMYGYLGRATDGKGYKWDWDGYDLNESKANSSLKHVQLFEQFINTLNEGPINESYKKAAAKLKTIENKVEKIVKKSRGWEIMPQTGVNQRYLDDNFEEDVKYAMDFRDESREEAEKYAQQYARWRNWDFPRYIVKDEIGYGTRLATSGWPVHKSNLFYKASSAEDYGGKGVHIVLTTFSGKSSKLRAMATFPLSDKNSEQWIKAIDLALKLNDVHKWAKAVEQETKAKVNIEPWTINPDEYVFF